MIWFDQQYYWIPLKIVIYVAALHSLTNKFVRTRRAQSCYSERVRFSNKGTAIYNSLNISFHYTSNETLRRARGE